MSQDRVPKDPPSRALANQLRRDIADGTLAPGDKLPSERALAAEHRIARNTAREAVRILAESGLVDAQHGRGVFVRKQPRLLRFGHNRYSRSVRERTGLSPFRAEVLAQGRTPSVQCTSIEILPAPEFVSERLELPHGTTVVQRENWYRADGEPVQVGYTYIAREVAGDTPLATSADLGPGSLYARFEDQGFAITHTREEITARMPTPQESQSLAIPDGVPVIDLIHTGLAEGGRPFEVTHFIIRADLNGLDYTMPVDL